MKNRSYLEQQIIKELQVLNLYPQEKPLVEYTPKDFGQLQKKFMKNVVTKVTDHVMRNKILYGVTATAISAPLIGYFYNSISREMLLSGIMGCVGIFAYGSAIAAKDMLNDNINGRVTMGYMGLGDSWPNTYHSLNIHDDITLNRFAEIALNSKAILRSDHQLDTGRNLGRIISRVADELLDAGCNEKLYGVDNENNYNTNFRLSQIVDIMFKNEWDSAEDTEKIALVSKNFTADEVSMYLRLGEEGIIGKVIDWVDDIFNLFKDKKDRKGLSRKTKDPHLKNILEQGVSVLLKYLSNYELILNINGVESMSNVAAVLSKGHVNVSGDVGHLCGSHLGLYSQNNDYARLFIEGDTDHSLLEKAMTGYCGVSGNVKHGCLRDATGGVLFVDGSISYDVTSNADDSTAPLIVVTRQGLDSVLEHGDVKNGLIVSLGEDRRYRERRPMAYRFRDGIIDKNIQRLPYVHKTEEAVLKLVTDYLQEWVSRPK
jgi:hypothetical protein